MGCVTAVLTEVLIVQFSFRGKRKLAVTRDILLSPNHRMRIKIVKDAASDLLIFREHFFIKGVNRFQ